ncbi:MAG: aminotransferase class V-fold PLP-dependent enzyme [Spirochaetaceae bacterium]|nr:aminotransferase class V-fold PLP-dependent enzyme [Spirochaetaceae bacterium]
MACNCERKERLAKLISDIRMDKKITYMDYNATTPVLTESIGAFERSCRQNWGNPSNCHTTGIKAWEELEKNREAISKYFNTKKENIFFCSSGSEAIFAGIHAILNSNTFFISTVIEHSSVLKNIIALPKEQYHLLKVSGNGMINIEEFSKVLEKNKEKNIVFIYSPVNHETGALAPIKEIYRKAKEYNALIFLDAVQAAARLSVIEWQPFCDIFTLSSHKLYAPKGCGVLALTKEYSPGVSSADKVSKTLSELNPFRFGGNQESGLFPGTENTPAISAFAKSIEYLELNLKSEIARLKTLTDEGLKILQSLPYKVVLESPENRAAGILCLSLPEVKEIEQFMDFIYLKGICISRFSACSDNEKAASEILTAMGCPLERAEKSIRISTGIYSKRDDYYALADAIKEYFKQ